MVHLSGVAEQSVAVVGLARTGLAACRTLRDGGARVVAWDDLSSRRDVARHEGIILAAPDAIDVGGLDCLVLSPGVPLDHPAPHPLVSRARTAGVEIIGDIELLTRALTGQRIVGVTGTNGKSTTTALTAHLLAHAGMDVRMGGNIGVPVLDLEDGDEVTVFVLELSSFQLDLTCSLTCRVAVWLNLSPDHLDRHGDLDGYVRAKRRIFDNQDAGDWAVIGVDDDISRQLAAELSQSGLQRVVPITVDGSAGNGVCVRDGWLVDALDGDEREIADLRPIPALVGRHNHQNAAAAYAVGRALGLEPEQAAAGLATFAGLPHRMEPLGTVGGVRYVNDSKATNPESAARSLACFDAIYWIAGGRAKDADLSPVMPHLGRVRAAFLIGEATPLFAGALDGHTQIERCGRLDEAFDRAREAAGQDGARNAVVLLAPACASFDQFADFEARGDAFRQLVHAARADGGQR